jgi:3-oxoacyl-[acyl-carrier-protein] synthase II
MTQKPSEVVVTGLGAISSAGPAVADLWDAAEEGRASIQALQFNSGSGEPACGGRVVAPIEEPDVRARQRLDRSGLLLLAALRQAWRDADLETRPPSDVARVGIIVGSSLYNLSGVLDEHAAWLQGIDPRPSDLVRCSAGAAASFAAWSLGIGGSVQTLCGGSVTSACALGEGRLKIAAGWLDICIVGGSEAPIHPIVYRVFEKAGVLARRGPATFRPFDGGRTGTLLGEAGAAIVLESERHAIERGVSPRASLLGYGASRDASFSWTGPDPDGGGLFRAARCALDSAALTPDDVDYVQLHGTGTRANDAAEGRAMARLFGVERARRVAASATKPITGHCLGASGAIETVTAIGALTREFVPPTLNYEAFDPTEVEIGVCPHPRRARVGCALVNTVGFGGQNAVLVLGRSRAAAPFSRLT